MKLIKKRLYKYLDKWVEKKKFYIPYIVLFIIISFNVYGLEYFPNNQTLSSSTSSANAWGFKLNVFQNITNLTFGAYADSAYAYVHIFDSGKQRIILNCTASGNLSACGDFKLVNGSLYYIVFGSNGASFHHHFLNSVPYNVTIKYFNIQTRYIRSSDSGDVALDGYTDGHMDFGDLTFNLADLVGAPAVQLPEYYVSTTQSPSDINTSFTGVMSINATITGNYTNCSWLVDSTANVSYFINTTLNSGCAIFYQKNCAQSSTAIKQAMTKTTTNCSFTSSLDDGDYYPGYYPFNYTIMENTKEEGNYTVYNNNYIMFNITNMSTQADSYAIILEFSAMNKTSSTNAMGIYYCNSSYKSGTPLTNINCVIVDAFVPTAMWSHIHTHGNNTWGDQSIPVIITNVTKTQQSYFLFVGTGTAANGWNFAYITNSSYNNQSFMTGNWNSWTTSNLIIRAHIHPINATDSFNYRVEFNDGNTTSAYSGWVKDYLNLTNYGPNLPTTTHPTGTYTIANTSETDIWFNWTTSCDANNDNITVNISIYEPLLNTLINVKVMDTQTSCTTNNSYNWTKVNTSTGVYQGLWNTYLSVCDIYNLCDKGVVGDSFTLCINNWSSVLQPCLGGVRLNYYEDINSCTSAYYNVPDDNGTYAYCNTTSYVEVINGGESMMIGLLLLPIIIGFVLLYWASQLDEDNILRLVFQFMFIPLAWISIHFGVLGLAEFDLSPASITLLGDLTYYLGWVLFFVGLFYIYRIFLSIYQIIQQKKADREDDLYG